MTIQTSAFFLIIIQSKGALMIQLSSEFSARPILRLASAFFHQTSDNLEFISQMFESSSDILEVFSCLVNSIFLRAISSEIFARFKLSSFMERFVLRPWEFFALSLAVISLPVFASSRSCEAILTASSSCFILRAESLSKESRASMLHLIQAQVGLNITCSRDDIIVEV